MKSAVIVFPGSNCDRDAAWALKLITGMDAKMVWYQDSALPTGTELVVVPGGFSYGDYLRSGAMAARAPIMDAVKAHAQAGRPTIGICNGFQVLTELQLLPGALMRNAGQTFICKDVDLRVENTNTPFTRGYDNGQVITVPVAHHDGNYFADADTLKHLEDNNQVAFRYVDNPNGSQNDIAGITNADGNVLGLMPHPERASDPALGNTDGATLFKSLMMEMA